MWQLQCRQGGRRGPQRLKSTGHAHIIHSLLDEDQRFAIILKGGISQVHPKKEVFKKTVCGVSCFPWSLEDEPTDHADGGLPISNCCLLLPLDAASKGNNDDSYYLITASWKEMMEDGTAIGLLRFPMVLLD